jgi:hypothetical protein
MKAKSKPQSLLNQMARIQWMERGKLCPMGAGAYYNHQTWEQGRNLVRYVPRERVGDLQKAIAGYQRYLKLTKVYADEIIQRTRQAQPRRSSPPTGRKRRKMPQPRSNHEV